MKLVNYFLFFYIAIKRLTAEDSLGFSEIDKTQISSLLY